MAAGYCSCGAKKRDGACPHGCQRYSTKRELERQDTVRERRLKKLVEEAAAISVSVRGLRKRRA